MHRKRIVNFCEICKRELKKRHGRFCTICGKLYASVKLRKYANGLTDTELFNYVKKLPTWKKLRGTSRILFSTIEGEQQKALKAGTSGLRPIGVR